MTSFIGNTRQSGNGARKFEKSLKALDMLFNKQGCFLRVHEVNLTFFGACTNVGAGVMTSSRFFPMILVYFG